MLEWYEVHGHHITHFVLDSPLSSCAPSGYSGAARARSLAGRSVRMERVGAIRIFSDRRTECDFDRHRIAETILPSPQRSAP